MIDELAPIWDRLPPLAIPTEERAFWRTWGELSGPGVKLNDRQQDLRRRMGPLVDERLKPRRRRARR